jgi:hypothetical protein
VEREGGIKKFGDGDDVSTQTRCDTSGQLICTTRTKASGSPCALGFIFCLIVLKANKRSLQVCFAKLIYSILELLLFYLREDQ